MSCYTLEINVHNRHNLEFCRILQYQHFCIVIDLFVHVYSITYFVRLNFGVLLSGRAIGTTVDIYSTYYVPMSSTMTNIGTVMTFVQFRFALFH